MDETETVSGYPNGEGRASFDPDIEAFLNEGSPLDRRFRATRFAKMSASTKRDLHVSLRELDRMIRAAEADDKAGLPWWKMARFGNVRTPLRPRPDGSGGMTGNSLRHDANVRGVTGLEADYDAGEIGFAEAERRLRQADVTSYLYETPSATAEHPKWRVIATFSEELPPADRGRLMARLNGIFGGTLDPASFTLSQSFYGGNVRGRPKIKTALIAGRYLDRANDLDAGAMGKRARAASEKGEAGSFDEASALDAIMTGAVYHDSMISLAARWAGQGVGYVEAVKRMEAAFDAVPEYQRDARWGERRADIKRTVLYTYGRDAAKPKDDEEAEPRVDPNDVFTWADVFDGEGLTDEERKWAGWPPREGAKPSGGLNFESVSAWGEEPPPRQWLVDGMIPHGDVTSLYGDGGVGKSLLAFQLAVSTATGRKWIGKDVQHQGTVLYLSAEDDRDELHRRAIGICGATAGLDRLKVLSLAGEDATLAAPDRRTGAMLPTPRYAALNDAVTAEQPTLVVLDTLADLHSGDQNDQMVGRQFIGLMRRLAFRHGCTIVLLAHPSKSGMANGTGDAGSVAWNNSVRSRLYFSRVLDKEGGEEDADVRTLAVRKTNHERVGGVVKLRWERGAFVNTEYFGDDDDTTPRESREAQGRRVFLKLLDETIAQDRHVSHNPGRTYAPQRFAERPAREGLDAKAFAKAMESLFADGSIRVGTHKSGGHDSSHLERAK